MLIWLPLESFEQRYTADWARWFPAEFSKNKVEYLPVNGIAITDKVNIGSVLDAYGTSHWKFTQLARVASMMQSGIIKSEDTLLFADLWYPGIEALRYISCLGGAKPKIVGILHAGTYDSADFTVRAGMRPWGHLLEEAWMDIYDVICVATQYHKDLILHNHRVDPNKIKITGLPFYPDELKQYKQQKDNNLVVFPHRLDEEKNPDEFMQLMSKIREVQPETKVIMTANEHMSKAEYYDTLGRASICVSMANQETFGYAMLEATALGCIPIVPDKLSYSEMYSRDLKYHTYAECYDTILELLRYPATRIKYRNISLSLAKQHSELYTKAISNIIKEALC
jgi:glycosyltransferase involved in cell wall biosynthesis